MGGKFTIGVEYILFVLYNIVYELDKKAVAYANLLLLFRSCSGSFACKYLAYPLRKIFGGEAEYQRSIQSVQEVG